MMTPGYTEDLDVLLPTSDPEEQISDEEKRVSTSKLFGNSAVVPDPDVVLLSATR